MRLAVLSVLMFVAAASGSLAQQPPPKPVSAAPAMTMGEGGSRQYKVRLSSVMSNPGVGVDVVVRVTSSDPSVVTVNTPNLTFAGGSNWDSELLVGLSAPADANQAYDRVTLSHEVVGHGSVSLPDVRVGVNDAQVEKAVIVSSKSIVLYEGGPSAEINIRYATDPGYRTSWMGRSVWVSRFDRSRLEISPEWLYLTGGPDGNWERGVTFKVTAKQDPDTVNNKYVFVLDIQGTSNHGYMDPLSPPNPMVSVLVVDDDNPSTGVTTIPSSLVLQEGADNANTGEYRVILNTDPGVSVTVNVANPDTSKLSISPTSLTFDSSKPWNEPQSVQVQALDDSDLGDKQYVIAHTVTGYVGVTIFNQAVTVVDAAEEQHIRTWVPNPDGSVEYDDQNRHIILYGGFVEGISAVTCVDGIPCPIGYRLAIDPVDEIGVGVFAYARDPQSNEWVRMNHPFPMGEISGGPDGNWRDRIIASFQAPEDADTAAAEYQIRLGAARTLKRVDGALVLDEYQVTIKVVTIDPDASSTATVLLLPDQQVTLNADDKPVVSIESGGAVGEGEDAVFRLTAVPAPSAPLTVSVDISQQGDFASVGTRVVTIPPGGTSTLVVPTVADTTDEADGSVIATIQADSGYRLGMPNVASVSVSDDDPDPAALPVVTVTAGGPVTEGSDAIFTIVATPPPLQALDVMVNVTQQGYYTLGTGSHTVTIPVTGSAILTVATVDDSIDEPDGSVTAAITVGSAYLVPASQTAAKVAVADDDDPAVLEGLIQERIDLTGRNGDDHSNRIWRRALAAVRGESPPSGWPVLNAALAQWLADGHRNGGRTELADLWQDIADTLNSPPPVTPDPPPVIPDPPPVPPVTPEVSIVGGFAVREGGDAVFVLTSSPPPSSSYDVTVSVSQQGAFLSRTGNQTVTIPTSGSVTLKIATTDDTTDEADGSVTMTVVDGTGYTVSASQSTATVRVVDNDDPPVAQTDTTVQPDTSALEGLIQERIDLTGRNGGVHSNRIWRRALAAVRGESPPKGLSELTAAFAQRLADGHRNGGRTELADLWQDIADTLNGVTPPPLPPPPPPPPVTPEVSITGGAGVTEGGDAVFTVTAASAPSSSLTVSVVVSQSGDFTSVGPQTVTVSSSGSATLAVATTDDSTDEPDGWVTATVAGGSGYTVSGSQNQATIAVSDDDDPPPPPPPVLPEVTIAAGAGVTEGGDAVFTVTAAPAPSSSLTVSVVVSQSGDFTSVGPQTVTVSSSGSATLAVATTDDSADEADGSVTATVAGGTGYTVGSSSSATVAVSDDDDPPPPPPPPPPVKTAGSLDCDNSGVIVDEVTVAENRSGMSWLEFNLTLCEINYGQVLIDYHMEHITTDDSDVYLWSGTLIIEPFAQKARAIKTMVYSDGKVEGDETVALVFTGVSTHGRAIDLGPGRVQGTITDPD